MVVGSGAVIVRQDSAEYRVDQVVTGQSLSNGAAGRSEGEASLVVELYPVPVRQDEELAHLEALGVFVARPGRAEHASSTDADNFRRAVLGRQQRSNSAGRVSVRVACPSHRDSVSAKRQPAPRRPLCRVGRSQRRHRQVGRRESKSGGPTPPRVPSRPMLAAKVLPIPAGVCCPRTCDPDRIPSAEDIRQAYETAATGNENFAVCGRPSETDGSRTTSRNGDPDDCRVRRRAARISP